MKKRLTALCLCLILLTGLLCTGAGADDVICFISVNDNLLDANTNPHFTGGVIYVPYSVFTDYSIKMYYSYLSDSSTAMLYTSDRQLFFDMKNDRAYGDNGKTYDAKAIVRGGVVYLPATFVCNYFGGMACSYIEGYGYGDIVRVKDSSFSLSDASFLLAASELLRDRYNSYLSTHSTTTPSRPDDEEDPPSSVDGAAAYLSFRGLPSDTLLSALKAYDVSACFFLTAEDVRSDPALVRRLDGEGHSLGVFCTEAIAADYETVSTLFFEAARVKTILITTDAANAEAAKDLSSLLSLVYVPHDADGAALIDSADGSIALLLNSGEQSYSSLTTLLRRMNDRSFDIRSPRETDLFE